MCYTYAWKWSGGEVVNTLGSHPSIQGFEPPTDYHFFCKLVEGIKKRAFALEFQLAGVAGFEPAQ